MFPEKYVRVFPETRTRICENTYVFWETDNEVLNAFGKMYNNYVENKHCIPFLLSKVFRVISQQAFFPVLLLPL